MRLVVYNEGRIGAILENKNVIDLNHAYTSLLSEKGEERPYVKADAVLPSDLLSLIKEGEEGLKAAQKALDFVEQGNKWGPGGEKLTLRPSEIWLRAPLPWRGSKIAMAGANFYDHSADVSRMMGQDVTEEDIKRRFKRGEYPAWGFWKMSSNVIGPDEPISYPKRTERLDYEVEVAAIIGEKCKDVKEEDAMKCIYGYTILNDISIRDEPRTDAPNGLFLSKNFDGSAPMGPCIVTKDELGDPNHLAMRQKVNGVTKQDSSMESIIRGFPWWISHLSRDMTLYPGDIICGGTCSGTALDTSPRVNGVTRPDNFLKPGDVVEAWVEKIGTLRNPIVEAE